MNQFLLLDGALMRGIIDCSPLLQGPTAEAIYGDLGLEAASAGPILTIEQIAPNEQSQTTTADRRAWQYGRAQISALDDLLSVASHLRAHRYLFTHDGQRFFLRYADARSLLVVWSILDKQQRQTLLGPIKRWEVRDSEDRPVALEASVANEASDAEIVLNGLATEALTQAMWPWNLLAAAEEADSSIVERDSDADKLLWCQRASALARRGHSSCAFAVETAVAVALIRSGGQASRNPQLIEAIKEAGRSGDPAAVQYWVSTSWPIKRASESSRSSSPSGD
jgi:hypothetical protein